MEISTYEAWLEWMVQDRERRAFVHANYVQNHPEYLQSHLERQDALERKHEELLQPSYTVITEGEYSEHDYACRWCWQHISPKHGQMQQLQSEYPACSLVLETEYIEQGTIQDKDGTEKPVKWKAYQDPGEHTHQGVWTSLWLGKTGYDYGFTVLLFCPRSRPRAVSGSVSLLHLARILGQRRRDIYEKGAGQHWKRSDSAIRFSKACIMNARIYP